MICVYLILFDAEERGRKFLETWQISLLLRGPRCHTGIKVISLCKHKIFHLFLVQRPIFFNIDMSPDHYFV